MDPVEVRYHGPHDVLVARGVRMNDVAGFRWGFEQDGEHHEQTSFVLVDEGFLLAQPVLFTGPRRGWWYCDLITVDDRGDGIDIADLYVDVLVGPRTSGYQVLDLDELAGAVAAGAVAAGAVAPAVARDGLARCQRWLDRHLNQREDPAPGWPDFPPAGVDPSRWDGVLPLDWRWVPREAPGS